VHKQQLTIGNNKKTSVENNKKGGAGREQQKSEKTAIFRFFTPIHQSDVPFQVQ
jgi:hypothetical protein